jgi:hypothetical protein
MGVLHVSSVKTRLTQGLLHVRIVLHSRIVVHHRVVPMSMHQVDVPSRVSPKSTHQVDMTPRDGTDDRDATGFNRPMCKALDLIQLCRDALKNSSHYLSSLSQVHQVMMQWGHY